MSGKSMPFSSVIDGLASQPLRMRTPLRELGITLAFQKYHGCAPCGTLGPWSVTAMSSRPLEAAPSASSVTVE